MRMLMILPTSSIFVARPASAAAWPWSQRPPPRLSSGRGARRCGGRKRGAIGAGRRARMGRVRMGRGPAD
eukprot:scaffold420_cov404-Prasinococcus_capsulatus_cf.AAC.10